LRLVRSNKKFYIYKNMKLNAAVARLSALAQESRLAIFRLLVQAGPEGLCAGDIGARLTIPAPTLTFHLKELSNAGLVKLRQEGRFKYYAPDLKVMNDLLVYLTENCCGGVPCLPEARCRIALKEPV
jgi:ArsR family transcriptional regulator